MENQSTTTHSKTPHLDQIPVEQSFQTLQTKSNLVVPILTTILISAIIFGLGGFYLGRRSLSLQKTTTLANISPTSTPTPVTLESVNNQFLSSLLNIVSKDGFKVIEEDSMLWVSNDNWSIFVKNNESIGLVKPEAYQELSDVNSQTSQLVSKIANFLKSQGFSPNERNFSKDSNDNKFVDYIQGYQKGEDICLITVNPDKSYHADKNNEMVADPNIEISCSNSFEADYNEQIPFLVAMNKRNEAINIQKNNGMAASASVRSRRGGAYALFSKKNGFWEMIYYGQDAPSCSILQKYSFPTEIHEGCLPF
ncbi:MAG TPA: hypothetical protein VF185_04140 [Patescibacteria group bacterium]